MPTYPTYKLGEIAKIYNGNSINAEEKEKKYKGVDGRNYIGTKDIEFDCSVNYSNGVRIPFDEKKFKIAPAGSVLVCAEGGSAGKKSAFITEDVCFGNKLFAITNNQGLFDGKYVFYYTRYKRFFDLFKNELSGLIGGVSSKKFGEIPIPLPPLPTQRAIVARIESLFAELDKGVEKLKNAQQQLNVYRQAVLNDCLTKGSEKWNCIEIEKVADVVSGYAFKSNLFKEVGTFQVIRIGNVKPGKIRKNENPVFYEDVPDKVLEKTLLKCNDVVITLTGTRKKRDYGFTALIDCENLLLNQRLAYFRFNQSIYNPKFFLYYTWTDLFKDDFFSYETGNVGQGNVGVKAITKTKIPLPSLPEQQRIVQEIETRLSACDEVEKNIAESLQQADALRQSILKKAFEGELV